MNWAVVGVCLCTLSCGGEDVCISDEGLQVLSEPLRGSFLLDEQGSLGDGEFEVTLSDLPGLWARRRPFEAWITLTVEVHYADPALSGEGPIELPLLDLRLRQNLGSTSQFKASAALTTSLFNLGSPEDAACKPGARQCRDRAMISIERLQGEPFPAVEANWTLQADAVVDTCPLDDSEPRISVEPL